MTTKRKNVQSVAVKAGDKGEISGVFATLDVVDHDGDILTKEAFEDGAPIVISAYGHRSHVGELPIGRGQIVLTDDEAQFARQVLHGHCARPGCVHDSEEPR